MDLRALAAALFPNVTVRYLAAARLFEQRSYEAAQGSQYRPTLRNTTSGDGSMQTAGTMLRQLSRQLEENHDLAVAVLDDLVNNTVGAGVYVAPMARLKSGALAVKTNDMLRELWEEWQQYPETTGEFGFEAMERIVLRSKFRDGEVFCQHVFGAARAFNYRTRIPYALELIEADLVPMDHNDPNSNLLHGIQHNAWNAPVIYWVYKNHPGDPLLPAAAAALAKKTVPAEQMIHLKFTRRLRQRRGVPVLHAALTRMRDLKDYEESERIAAKVAADFTWFIRRTGEYNGPAMDPSVADNRTMQMAAGTGFTLLPGEDVGTIASSRPNTGLEAFRDAMLRAVAGGTGTRFSSIARNYNGTYSAQRQELVEGAIAYRAHFAEQVRRFYRPVYQQFIEAAQLAVDLGRADRGLDRSTLARADFRAPALPWIDPAKEATAYAQLIESRLESRQEIMRQRGRDPVRVWEEIKEEQAAGLFASAIEEAAPPAGGEAPEDEGDEEAAA